MFEKTLNDLVRGIRNNKKNEAKYISQCIQEIKEELKTDIPNRKALGIQKLTYLQMLGYDISWAAFNIVEVMSHTRFTNKRIGYLAASQSFHDGTEVVMLATNLIRKDFTSNNQYEAGVALNSLANVCTPDLARDLASDLVTLMNSSKPYVRKKAVLVMYKVFLKYPDALRPAFPRLKEKLEDADQAVVSSAVNVICELSRKNPKNYLSLAPTLFKLLTSNYNNWMLIKIIKLFGVLTPLEPRLAKKLVEPLSTLINTTPAMSLLYECIQTCTIGMGEHLPVIKLCITKLRAFIEDPDQNLKYLGLLALNNIMKIHPKAVAEHRDMVLNCLDDEDVTIRLRALELLTGMISKRNLPEIVRKLLEHLEKADGNYRDELVQKIVQICSQGSYQYITDFEWYLNVLIQLVHVIHGTQYGPLIAGQILDVVIRVKVVRPYGIKHVTSLLRDPRLLTNPQPNGVCEVLYAASWIIGEFCNLIENPEELSEVIEAMLQPRATVLPPHIQGIFMQNVLKVFSHAVGSESSPNLIGDDEGETNNGDKEVTSEFVAGLVDLVTSRLPLFTQSTHLEVQERACFVLETVRAFSEFRNEGVDVSQELRALFEEALNPVAPKIQKKVPIPEGLDLDQWINDPKADVSDDEDEFVKKKEKRRKQQKQNSGQESSSDESGFLPAERKDKEKEDAEELARQKEERRQRLASNAANPYMLGARSQRQSKPLQEEPNIPIEQLPSSLSPSGLIVGIGMPKSGERDKKGRRKRGEQKHYEVDKTVEMPEGIEEVELEKQTEEVKDALAAIDITTPLEAFETLPVARHRTEIQKPKVEEKPVEKKESKDRKSRHGEEGGRRHRSDKEKSERKKGDKDKKAKEGSLIDFDLGVDASANANAVTSPPTVSSPSTEAKESYLELESPLDSRVQEKKKERHHSHRDRDSKDKDRHRKDKKEGSESSKKDSKDKDREKDKEKEKEKKEEKVVERPKSTKKLLLEDADIRILYDCRASSSEKGKIAVGLFIESKSSHTLNGLDFQFSDTLNVRKAGIGSGGGGLVGDVPSLAKITHQIPFTVANITMPQKIKGFVVFTVEGGSSKKLEVNLALNCSAFIAGEKLSKEQFQERLTSESSLSLSSTKLKSADFKGLVTAIADLIHLEIVQLGANIASMYGKSILGHHVAMLVKDRGDSSISVDIKCSDQTLGISLISEINAGIKG